MDTTTTTDETAQPPSASQVLLSTSKIAPGMGVKKPRGAGARAGLRKEKLWFRNRDRHLINEARLHYAGLIGKTPSAALVIRRALEVLGEHLAQHSNPEAEALALVRAANSS